MCARLLTYGANGYTGRLAVERAAEVGLDVVVAGRDAEKISGLGDEFGVESRSFSLDDPEGVRTGLQGVACVLHVAGPLQMTAQPMMRECLDAGMHYVDVAAEYPTSVLAQSMDEVARRAGVMVLSGGGWQSVPATAWWWTRLAGWQNHGDWRSACTSPVASLPAPQRAHRSSRIWVCSCGAVVKS